MEQCQTNAQTITILYKRTILSDQIHKKNMLFKHNGQFNLPIRPNNLQIRTKIP